MPLCNTGKSRRIVGISRRTMRMARHTPGSLRRTPGKWRHRPRILVLINGKNSGFLTIMEMWLTNGRKPPLPGSASSTQDVEPTWYLPMRFSILEPIRAARSLAHGALDGGIGPTPPLGGAQSRNCLTGNCLPRTSWRQPTVARDASDGSDLSRGVCGQRFMGANPISSCPSPRLPVC